MRNVEVHVFPGVRHGYMMRAAKAFDAPTREFSMGRARAILDGLRGAPTSQSLRRAS
jgi:carboxymethylenebutenolidase